MQKWQWATSSFFLLHSGVHLFLLQNTQRAPDTRWGSIDGHWGVLEIFCVFFFLSAYFFCVCVLMCSALAATVLGVSQPQVPLD